MNANEHNVKTSERARVDDEEDVENVSSQAVDCQEHPLRMTFSTRILLINPI